MLYARWTQFCRDVVILVHEPRTAELFFVYSYALMAVSTWDGVDNMNGGGWLVTRAGSTKDELIRRVNSSWSG